MVMPRSRSRSMVSRTCSAISRSARPPHIWMKRSASVDLPWSMCAMIEKLRMRCWGVKAKPCKRSAILAQLGDRLRAKSVREHRVLKHENGNVAAIPQPQVGIGVDVDLLELHAERAELGRHLLAEMAAAAAVQPSLCQSAPKW